MSEEKPAHTGRSKQQVARLPASASRGPFIQSNIYRNHDRQFICLNHARIYKTFPSSSLVALQDEGVGRLKGIFDVWLTKAGETPCDKLGGFFAIGMVSANELEGTIIAEGKSHTHTLRKHDITCLYTGSGLKRSCKVGNSGAAFMGTELWIKGSALISGPWLQSMHVSPSDRYNKLCQIAGPMPDYNKLYNNTRDLVVKPDLSSGPSSSGVFELDSDVYIYVCRLAQCSSVEYTVKDPGSRGSAPPAYKMTKLRRATTLQADHRAPYSVVFPQPGSIQAQSIHRQTSRDHENSLQYRQARSKKRSVYIHVTSTYSKDGITGRGGGKLYIPGDVTICNGDGVNMINIVPGTKFAIKSVGFDRAEFLLIDMPSTEEDAYSV
ncbi:hypothetical protein FBU59_002830 [Linderina macrospora]|uniref:Uncharacterized protein n=1 Tax=Linderina macrospora TaxID=4868 RepID=A0ACC1JAB0_9FUNG|nr:hypothetical protein FBU59_002830 [Linderina macrospora]